MGMQSSEDREYRELKARVEELMVGGPGGDGIGPKRTADAIWEEFGVEYPPEEIHLIRRESRRTGDSARDKREDAP